MDARSIRCKMRLNEVLLLVALQQILLCCGSNGEELMESYNTTTHVHGKNLLSSATTDHAESPSLVHCCALCHVTPGCQGAVHAEKDCWFIDATKPAREIFNGECSTCSYRVMMRTFNHPSIDCKSLLEEGFTEDGVYTINPSGNAPFQAFCDMSGGGWTVIQRRVDASVDFYRTYAEYVAGFGDPAGNVWAGLENIHDLTYENSELLVTMATFEGEEAQAHYSSFSVADAASGYLLSIGGYSGDAGDSFTYHSGRQFSTYDHDSDKHATNCAVDYRGGWWYGGCHHSNPNGLYLNGVNSQHAQGVVWFDFKGHGYSLKTMEFKVRRI